MAYYDQHLHTRFSFDSEELFENYLKRTSNTLVSTEHLDLANPIVNFEDSVPDYEGYSAEIARLSQSHNRKILRGIEIGFVKADWERIEQFLSDKDYDVQLLSVHQNGKFDYMDDIVLTLNREELIKEYYQNMIEAVKAPTSANILTHFDYGVRRLDIEVEEFAQIAEPLLIELFTMAVEKELALELNAKSFVKFHNDALYEYAIPLYQSLGGELYTLGSDAHVAEDYELGFDEMKVLLKKNGVAQLATFEKQQRTMVNF